MVTLFWGNKERFEPVAYCPEDEVTARMVEYLEEHGYKNELFYIRSWTENGVTHYDYGDWTYFFYSVPFGISFPGLED